MADFALWSIATEAFAPGVFIKAFEGAAVEATEAVVESDPVVVAVAAFMTAHESWNGTAAELLFALCKHDYTEAVPTRSKSWPREPASFGKKLRVAMSVLRKIGVEVVIGRALDRRRTRAITLRKIEASERPHIVPNVADVADGADGADTSTATGAGRASGPRLIKN